MHKSQSLFYLTTALHVSVVTITHLQEHKTTVTTASGNRYTVFLSAAIVEEVNLYPANVENMVSS
jgi:translation elongation factor EF-Tu-like GTPase